MLSMIDIARKGRTGSVRVIMELFLGALTDFSNKYRWTRVTFNLVTYFCFSLTNFHVRIHPLYEQDFEYYKKVLAIFTKELMKPKQKNKRRQLRHRQCKVRMELSFDKFRQNNDEELSNDGDDVPVYDNVINELAFHMMKQVRMVRMRRIIAKNCWKSWKFRLRAHMLKTTRVVDRIRYPISYSVQMKLE